MAGQGAWGVVELLRSPRLLPIPVPLCSTSQAAVADCSTPLIAKGPLRVVQHRSACRAILAESANPTPVARTTSCRQRITGCHPRDEPDALAGMSGYVREAPGNRRPYRDEPGPPEAASPATACRRRSRTRAAGNVWHTCSPAAYAAGRNMGGVASRLVPLGRRQSEHGSDASTETADQGPSSTTGIRDDANVVDRWIRTGAGRRPPQRSNREANR